VVVQQGRLLRRVLGEVAEHGRHRLLLDAVRTQAALGAVTGVITTGRHRRDSLMLPSIYSNLITLSFFNDPLGFSSINPHHKARSVPESTVYAAISAHTTLIRYRTSVNPKPVFRI